MSDFVKIPPPERRRRPDYYSADELHQILVDDGVKHRPLGGRGQHGIQWMTDALQRIGAQRRTSADAAFNDVLADIESKTGRKWVAVG